MLTTVVGNYPKIANTPEGQQLRQAIARFDRQEITREQLGEVADQVTREVIDEQVRAGIDVVTDGMIRWEDGQTYLARGLDGFEISGLIRYFDTNTYYRQPVANGPVRWRGPITVRDYQFARAHTPRIVKPVLTGPYTLAKLSLSHHHPNLRAFALELAEALSQELFALQEAGAELVQIDEPAITRSKSDWPLFSEAMHRLVRTSVGATALYTYFGDVAGLDGFFDLPFQVFGLDFVSGRGNWDLLAQFPRGARLGVGVVDAREVKLESPESISAALKRAGEYVDPEHLYVNPNCGLEFLPREVAYEKLDNMVNSAGRVKEKR